MAAIRGKIDTLLSSATATTTSFTYFSGWHRARTFQANGSTTAGAGAATIKIQVTNGDPSSTTHWLDLGTITLTLGTASISDGFVSEAPWAYYRANVTAISGTGAAVSARCSWIVA